MNLLVCSVLNDLYKLDDDCTACYHYINCIKFVFTDHKEREIIREAMSHWQDQTCVRFQEVSFERRVYDQHLLITDDGYSCSSYVGKVQKSVEFPQTISYASKCFENVSA